MPFFYGNKHDFCRVMGGCRIFALVATLGLALAQQDDSSPSGSKPTKADVQKVVQIISSNKAKAQSYCDINKLCDQMQKAAVKNDTKTVEALGKQINALEVIIQIDG